MASPDPASTGSSSSSSSTASGGSGDSDKPQRLGPDGRPLPEPYLHVTRQRKIREKALRACHTHHMAYLRCVQGNHLFSGRDCTELHNTFWSCMADNGHGHFGQKSEEFQFFKDFSKYAQRKYTQVAEFLSERWNRTNSGGKTEGGGDADSDGKPIV